MRDLDYPSLHSWLVSTLPELEARYEEELEWWVPEIPGPHIVAGDILAPFLLEALERGDDPGLLERIFGVIERLASSSTPAVRDVAGVSLLPSLMDDTRFLTAAPENLGPCTRRMVEEIQRWRSER